MKAIVRSKHMKYQVMRSALLVAMACAPMSCTSIRTDSELPVDQSETVHVLGFVVTPGEYSYHPDMTVADALALAGGHGKCGHCEDFLGGRSGHPSYTRPIILTRTGNEEKIHRADWKEFKLQPGDAIRVRHIWL